MTNLFEQKFDPLVGGQPLMIIGLPKFISRMPRQSTVWDCIRNYQQAFYDFGHIDTLIHPKSTMDMLKTSDMVFIQALGIGTDRYDIKVRRVIK